MYFWGIGGVLQCPAFFRFDIQELDCNELVSQISELVLFI